MPHVSFKEGKIHYTDSGKGKALVLLHGFLESSEVWNGFHDELWRNYRVICVDLPGHGNSSCFGYCHSMELMAEAVLSVIKSLNIRRIHLIGHSMGGYVAMALAEIAPDNIRSLCLLHSTSGSDSAVRKKERDATVKLVQKRKALFIQEAIPNLFNTAYKPFQREIKKMIRMAESIPLQGIIAAIEGMKIRNSRELLLKFAPYPICIISGKHDKVIPLSRSLNEAELSSNVTHVVLENSAHMGFIEEPVECLSSLLKFLKKG